MKSVGQTGSSKPRTRPGDFERAWEVIVFAGGDLKTREYLKELVAAQAAYDKAGDDAQAAESAAAKREGEAQAAEAKAIRERQKLADETATATAALGKREKGVTERERLATEAEQSQTARDEDLARREGLLREAGVAGF